MQEAVTAAEKTPVAEMMAAGEKGPAQILRGNGQIRAMGSVRRRLTPAIARQQDRMWLIDTYESAGETLRRVRDGAIIGPATFQRVKKIYAITRAELKRRGATDEELDYETDQEPVAGEETTEANDNSL